jgi:hypothetical protein
MQLRSILFFLCVSLLPLFSGVAVANNPIEGVPTSIPLPIESSKVTLLQNRVSEINAMDFSTLTRLEKRELKKELKGLKRDIKGNGGGVYISLGGLLIIIILLIILL